MFIVGHEGILYVLENVLEHWTIHLSNNSLAKSIPISLFQKIILRIHNSIFSNKCVVSSDFYFYILLCLKILVCDYALWLKSSGHNILGQFFPIPFIVGILYLKFMSSVLWLKVVDDSNRSFYLHEFFEPILFFDPHRLQSMVQKGNLAKFEKGQNLWN